MMVSTNPHPDSGDDLQGVTVLVVEDDYFIANEICAVLRDRGVSVLGPASDVDGGLQLLNRSSCHCAVLDINLHGELAFELATQIQRRGVPVIFATGYDATVIPASFNGVVRLEKPVNLGELLRVVKQVSAHPASPPMSQHA